MVNATLHDDVEPGLNDSDLFKRLIAEVLQEFLETHPNPDNGGGAAVLAFRRVLQYLRVDLGFLLRRDDHSTCTLVACSEAHAPRVSSPADLPLPWILGRALAGEIVSSFDLGDLPAGAARDVRYLQQHGIRSILAVPLRMQSRVSGVMVLGCSDRQAESTSDTAQWMRTTVELIAGLWVRDLHIAELEEQQRFDILLDHVAERLDNLPTNRTDEVIEDVQRVITQSLGLQRSSLFQFSQDQTELLLTHLYDEASEPQRRKQIDPQCGLAVYWARAKDNQPWQRVEVRALFPWCYEQIIRGHQIILSTLDDLPAEATADRESFERYQTKSTVVIPLLIEGQAIGCLTFAAVGKPRAWPPHLIKRLKFVSDVFAGALARKRSDLERIHSENRCRAITTCLPIFLFQFYARTNGDWGMYYVDSRSLDVTGVAPDPLNSFLERFADCIPPAERERWWGSIELAVQRASPWEYEGRFIKPGGDEICVRMFSHARRMDTEVIFDGMLLDITEQQHIREEHLKTEVRFHRLYETMWDAFGSIDLAGRVQECNPALQQMLGYTEEELCQLTVEDITPPKWHALERRLQRDQTLVRGYTDIYEKELRRKDGSVFPVELRAFLIRDECGQPASIWAIVRDITDRKLAEETLRQRNRYIETILEQAPIGFAVHTVNDGIAQFVSSRFEEIYGVPRGSIDSLHTFFEKVWPRNAEFREHIKKRVLADMGSGDPARVHWEDVPVFLPSGDVRYISAVNIPLAEQNLVVSTVQDVTGRVHAEKKRQEVELRFRQVAESISDFIWEVDADGLYTYASPSVEKILGYRPEELVGKKHFFDLFAPESRDELSKAAAEAIALRRPFRAFPNVNISKNGNVVHLETSGVPMIGEDGKLIGYRGADTDVTERKRAEAEQRKTLEQLRQLEARLREENVILRREVAVQTQILGQGLQPAMQDAQQVAGTDSTVLILGETGTGKGLLAQHIHRISGRSASPLITVNIASLPVSLMESELFGHERGAFTGALGKRLGRFEIAHNGTLFLDEIGEMPLETQAKLLRVLQDGDFERLGSSQTVKVNVRVIAATNRDLGKLVQEGKFREDLYYRLNVFPIYLPPLRDHPEDIGLLVEAFVHELSQSMGKPIEQISRKELDALRSYSWPGNVRELRNVVERCMILANGPVLQLIAPKTSPDPANGFSRQLEDVERAHVTRVLTSTHGKVGGPGGAAQILGLKPSTLFSLMKRLGISRVPEERGFAAFDDRA